jgi:hypothetical protein
MAVNPTKEQADFMHKATQRQQMLDSGLITEEEYVLQLLHDSLHRNPPRPPYIYAGTWHFDIPEHFCGHLGHKHRWPWAAKLCERLGYRLWMP